MKKTALHYVALGDSFTWGFVDLYAKHIQADLGATVTLHDRARGGQRSDELLHTLRADAALRGDLRAASIVTFMVPMAYFQEPSIAYLAEAGAGSEAGLREAYARYRMDARAITQEILSLCDGTKTMIRAMDCYLPPFLFGEWTGHGVFPALKSWWERFDQTVIEAVEAGKIPVARVRRAFNGETGDKNPVEYIGEDGWHTNAAGAALIARLHRDLGYAPMEM